MVSYGFNKIETTKKCGENDGKIDPDEPSGQDSHEYLALSGCI